MAPVSPRPGDRNQPSIPKIQRAQVQPYLRKRTDFEKHYNPKLLSIGPIHHRDDNLQLGEHYKERWTRAYLFVDAKLNEAAALRLYQNFARKIEDFKNMYSKDAIKEYKDENKNGEHVWMLFVDGCSILHVMNNAGNWDIEAATALEIKMDQLALLIQDMLLLENQLPYELPVQLTGDEHKTKQSMLKLLRNHKMVQGRYTDNTNNLSHEIIIDEGPRLAHLLDCLHKIVAPSTPSLPSPKTRSGDHSQKLINSYKIRNIQELNAAGISVVRSGTGSIEDVNFKPKRCGLWTLGHLELPEMIVDDFTAPTFMKLIAYEMCPDFPNKFGISSYVAFLDLLIDHQDDVKGLRSAGVLRNHLGNDEEVVKLFNTITTDLIVDGSKYARVKNKIEEHCNAKWNTWIAKLFTERFSSPWTCVAFFGGYILFVLTVVQIVFTIRTLK